MTNHDHDRAGDWWLALLIALAALMLVGCGSAPALQRWEAAMSVYTAANNYAADSFDAGKLTVDDLKDIRARLRPVRELLNAWGATISVDGKTSDASAEAAATVALDAARAYLLKARKP